MSLQSVLEELVQTTENIASIQFRSNINNVADDLIKGRKRPVRDPDQPELKLAALCTDGPLAAKIRSDFSPAVIIGLNDREQVDRMLRAAASLNQICGLPEVDEKIDELAQMHEDRQLNLEYFKKSLQKTNAEIDDLTLINSQPEEAIQNNNRLVAVVDHEVLRKEELELKRLSQEWEERKQESQTMKRRKEEQLRVRDEFQTMVQQRPRPNGNSSSGYSDTTASVTAAEIESLEQQIKTAQKQIDDYDKEIASLENNVQNKEITPKANIGQVFLSFRAKMDRLKSNTANNTDLTSDASRLVSLFEEIEPELQSIVDTTLKIQEQSLYNNNARTIYQRLADYIFAKASEPGNNLSSSSIAIDLQEYNQLFSSDFTEEMDLGLNVSKEVRLLAVALTQVLKEESITLPNLTTYIDEYVKENKLEENYSSQSIYKLVGAGQLEIDRTHADSLVKIKSFENI